LGMTELSCGSGMLGVQLHMPRQNSAKVYSLSQAGAGRFIAQYSSL
jgi:hypothetical protein